MARINQYPLDDEINLNDKWIGSDGNTLVTKNFSVQQLFEYFQQNLSIETSDLTIINNLEDSVDEIETEFTISNGSITSLSSSSIIKSYVDTEISGVNQISSTQESQIAEAHGWGNHASAGYLTSFTETDPNVPSHVKSISSTDISQWDSSYTNMITGIDITENSDGSVKTVTLVRANAGSNLSNSFTDISETGSGGITDTNFYLSGANLDSNGDLNLTVTGASNQSVNLDARYYTETEVDAFNYISLTSISVGADAAASGGGGVDYNNSTGVFTYTPPDFSGSYLPISGGTLTGNLFFSTESIGVVGNILNTNGTKILENGSDSAEAWYKGRLIGDITDASLNLIYDSSAGSMHKDLFMYRDSDEEYDIVLGYTAQIDFTNDRSDSQAPIETLTAAKISTWDSLEPIANMYFFEEGSTNTFRLRLRRQTDSLSTNTSALIQQGAFMTISVVDDSSDTYTYGGITIGSLNVALNYAGIGGLRETLDNRYAQITASVSGITVNSGSVITGTVNIEDGTSISAIRDGATNNISLNFDKGTGNSAYLQESDIPRSNWNTAYNSNITGIGFASGSSADKVDVNLVTRDAGVADINVSDILREGTGITMSADSTGFLTLSVNTNTIATQSYVASQISNNTITSVTVNSGNAITGDLNFTDGTNISAIRDGATNNISFNFDNSSTGFITQSTLDNFSGSSNIATVGTITSGTWNGGVIASAYLDSDTAHLSGSQTFTGQKTFNQNVTAPDFVLSSDRDLKENIIPLQPRKIKADFKEYNFKGSKRTRFGVIAQELEEDHPEFVHTRESGDKSVSYIDLLVAKVHELENRIKELENGSRNR